MKKTFITFAILIASLSGFSQSFSVDPRSMSVPRYANQAAITAAIPSPTEGQMVYNNTLDQFAYYNGTAWTNFPSASSSSGPVLWAVNAAGLIAANQGYNGIEVLNITAVGSHGTLARPLINADGGGTTFFRFGRPQGNWAISEEVVTTPNPSTSSVNWRYNDNASPQAATHLFGYSANTFNVTGALNATGAGTVGGDLTINGFTKLSNDATTTTAGVTKSSPAIKTLLLTGSLTSGASPESNVSLLTTVAHTLNYSKIIDIKVLVNGVGINGGFLVEPNFVDSRGVVTGLQYSTYNDGNNVYIIRNSTNSNNIKPVAGNTTATYRIFITYIP